jgi:hypothetical protein
MAMQYRLKKVLTDKEAFYLAHYFLVECLTHFYLEA